MLLGRGRFRIDRPASLLWRAGGRRALQKRQKTERRRLEARTKTSRRARRTRPALQLLGFAEGLEVDAELLALLVEVGAFEAEGASDVGHMEIVAANFGEEDFPLKDLGAPVETSLPRGGCRGSRCGDHCVPGGEDQADVIFADGVLGREKS